MELRVPRGDERRESDGVLVRHLLPVRHSRHDGALQDAGLPAGVLLHRLRSALRALWRADAAKGEVRSCDPRKCVPVSFFRYSNFSVQQSLIIVVCLAIAMVFTALDENAILRLAKVRLGFFRIGTDHPCRTALVAPPGPVVPVHLVPKLPEIC